MRSPSPRRPAVRGSRRDGQIGPPRRRPAWLLVRSPRGLPARRRDALFGPLICLLVTAAGCGGRDDRPPDAGRRQQATARQASSLAGMRQQLLAGLVSILSELDRYDRERAAEQVFDRLNQWSHATAGGPERTVGRLVGAELARLPASGREILERSRFDPVGDVIAIRDRCWLAEVARTATGDAVDDLAVAERLFEWTVRGLAPVSDPPMVPTEAVPGSRWFLPGEILLAGRASGPQRAWIFMELLHQVGLEAVMLGTPGPPGTPARPWLPAVLIDGEAYLFEPTYGLPVPGPEGRGVATLRQAAADPAILAALSLPDRPYPVTAADLGRVAVLVAGDPWSLAPRMARLDESLAAEHGIRVFVAADGLADRAADAIPGGAVEQGIWTFPWETVARRPLAGEQLERELGPLELPIPDQRTDPGRRALRRPLFAGRVREFRGDLDGPGGAKEAYLSARVSRRVTKAAVAGLPEDQAEAISRRLGRVKEDATYWLGLVMLAEGQNEAAVDYLGRMILEDAPDSRWADAARINLAAAVLGLGRREEAAALLREDRSPQRFGSRLRADRLEAGPPDAPGLEAPPPEAARPDAEGGRQNAAAVAP